MFLDLKVLVKVSLLCSINTSLNFPIKHLDPTSRFTYNLHIRKFKEIEIENLAVFENEEGKRVYANTNYNDMVEVLKFLNVRVCQGEELKEIEKLLGQDNSEQLHHPS